MSGDEPRAVYTYGHHQEVVQVHARRSAEREAAFFLPFLRPGMRLLDAGCGPGSITAGLAARVAPGETVGIDFAPAVVQQAAATLAEAGPEATRMLAADATRLPFADAVFDAVFAHTLLEHVADGFAVLRELRRVLRPGGLIGLRDCDWDSAIWAPADESVARAVDLYARVWRRNGGHPNCGRELRGLLLETGFSDVRSSTSFRWDGSPEETRAFADLLATRLPMPEFADVIAAERWATREEVTSLATACRAWAAQPNAYAAVMMVEAVGVVVEQPISV
jgi:ubiquinone/menaquinone biosynthesis C-methylase UbiE